MDFLKDIFYYLKTHKKWWLIPIILMVIFFVLMISVAQVAPVLAPFIYTIF